MSKTKVSPELLPSRGSENLARAPLPASGALRGPLRHSLAVSSSQSVLNACVSVFKSPFLVMIPATLD